MSKVEQITSWHDIAYVQCSANNGTAKVGTFLHMYNVEQILQFTPTHAFRYMYNVEQILQFAPTHAFLYVYKVEQITELQCGADPVICSKLYKFAHLSRASFVAGAGSAYPQRHAHSSQRTSQINCGTHTVRSGTPQGHMGQGHSGHMGLRPHGHLPQRLMTVAMA